MTDSKIHNQRAHTQMTKAIASIILSDPFYGYMLLRQDVIQNPNIESASTNGNRIQYNPEWTNTLTFDQLKGLLKHEIMHIAHMHHLRRGIRSPDKWNKAADYVINAHLIEAGEALPPDGLIDKQYIEHSTEHVYSILPDDPEGPGEGEGEGPGPKWNFGGVEDAPGSHDPTIHQQLEADIKVDIIQAANAAKMMGKLPAHIERLVTDIKESKMPWKHILARFFRSTSKSDSSWMRPNRRMLANNIYLPGLYSESLGEIVVGVDTSGSVGIAELEEFFSCINGILKQTKPSKVHVIYCDAEVHNTQVFTPADFPLTSKKFKPQGGGGTAFEPVFEYVAEKRLDPVVLLYLTDMYGSFPTKKPKYPTIWCATSEIKAPFGKTLEIK